MGAVSPAPGFESAASGRALRVAWLYPLPKRRLLEAYRRGDEPDQLSGIDAIRSFGIFPDLIDPLPRPWNPWSGRHSLYAGIDPLRAIRLLVSLRRYDAVLSVGESSALVLALLKRVLRLRTPIVVWDPALGGTWRMRRRILDIVLPRVDRILVVGSNQIDHLHRDHPNAAPARVIYHWEDTDFYRPAASGGEGRYILSVGNDPARDFECLIEAARGLDIDVVIKTSRRIDVPLPANVRVMPQRIPFTALRDLYAGARLVVVPLGEAVHAGGVNSVLEALAMGKPTIVSDSQGIRDFIRADETVLTVPPGDSAALRQAIETLAADPVLAARLAANGRDDVEKKFCLSAFARRLAAELHEVWAASR
jgi:glycosyltransferase involved in cell wall biosynthesis